MEGYGEHLYGIDKDDIMQHRDNASATKIIGKHGTLKKTTLFRYRWTSLIYLSSNTHKITTFLLSVLDFLLFVQQVEALLSAVCTGCLLAESNDSKGTSVLLHLFLFLVSILQILKNFLVDF
jgi:hypothetical protein